jgi:hypothetical protein
MYMEVTSPTDQKVFKVMNYEFQCVNKFKYPDTLVTNNNKVTAEINYRIGYDMIDCSHLLLLVPRFMDFSTLKMEAICSSETLVHTRST